MQKTFKLGWLGRFTVMYFAVVLMLSVLSPIFQITKSEAASASLASQSDTRATTGPVDYVVTDSFSDNILGVKATYYDYLSDEEHNNGWLKPMQAGTGHSGSSDDWYPFYVFNQKLSSYASSNTSWSTPLYFGNFCNSSDAYPNGNDHDSNGWSYVTNSTNAYNFNYPANNSNALSNDNASYQGLVHSSLINNQLYVNSSVQAPYFNNQWLKDNNVAKIIEGEFPFTIETENGYKKYSFNSKNAEDNVYFTWATSGSTTYPTTVNYGSGSSYGVEDGIKYFMYNSTSGTGIFPFNNASSTNKGTKTNSNENLNYGFGIRMDIEFRVPENGLIPGTSTPIQFDFTGDDDLWVYITDNDTGKSQLVLDMGGAHKESHGSINFNAKTSTVDYVYDADGTSSSETRYVYLSKDNVGWSNESTYAYFFNSSGDVGKSWPGYNMSTYGDGNNLRAEIPSGATHVIFNNSGSQTANIELSSTNGAYWLSNTLGVNQWDIPPTDAGLTSASGGVKTNVTNTFDFDNTSDQKTYTMSVFYMERGLIESNMSISFTMTPLDSDLEVSKNVNTTDVNSGLTNELLENENFTYTVYNDPDTDQSTSNYALATNKSYSHTTSSGTTSTDGKFSLKDNESAKFDAQFSVNTGMKIVENTKSDAGLSYSTTWKLTDKVSGSTISTGSSATSTFNLINSSNDADSKTSLLLAYTNTPSVAPLKVQKKVVDESNKDISSSTSTEFTYNIALDLYEGDSYNSTLDLAYTKYNSNGIVLGTYTATDGTFKLAAGQYAIFSGIPVGTRYKITEQVQDGYSMSSATINGTATTVSGNSISGAISSTSTVSAVITNKYIPASTALTAYKTLDGELYSGNDFSFKVTGLASKTLSGVTTKNTSSVSMTVNSATNGIVTFANTSSNAPFTYNTAGTYCYKIEEVVGSSTDYVYDSSVYYAKVVVTSNASTGELTVSTPTYYTDEAFSNQIVSQSVLFANENATCELRVIKKNFNKTEVLEGGEFKLVAAIEDIDGNWIQDQGSDFISLTSSVSNYNGSYYAEFKDVPQGEYLVIETKAPAGYEISDTPVHVTVKRTADNNGIVTVDFSDMSSTFLPKAGGVGVTIFAVIGIACLLTSLFFLSHKSKKERKEYSGRHYR